MNGPAATVAFEQVGSPSLDADLSALDPEIAAKIGAELTRQRDGLEMIASDNHTAPGAEGAGSSVDGCSVPREQIGVLSPARTGQPGRTERLLKR
ncbi:hypothetical protein NicSoilB8_45410 (plasmid) [Arthrobacter sp. NicSoilB8]|nr:hypothetical protein NicSoilB8_45410 [Arthrobacter sp. NicSoilB8]